MIGKLKIDFLRGPDPVAISKGRIIRTMLADHPYHKEPLPQGVPTPDQLGEVIDRLQTACDEAQCHDVNKIEAKRTLRESFNNYVRNLARHLEIYANGDPAKLQHLGFEVTQPPRKPAAIGPLPPPVLTLKHGSLPGSILLHIMVLIGSKAYEVQMCTGEPGNDDSWLAAGVFSHPSRIEITGLTAGQQYWFRARGIGAAGYGAWSAPARLMSL